MERIMHLLKQYRYGVLVLLIGLGLMLVPTDTDAPEPRKTVSEDQIPTLSDQLAEVLSQIDGAGEVRILLTESSGETTLYQQDTNQSGDSLKEETVIVSDADRGEQGLVTQIIPARYQGAVVVCQGGDRASIRLAMVEAVSAVTGLSADKITVLKMK